MSDLHEHPQLQSRVPGNGSPPLAMAPHAAQSRLSREQYWDDVHVSEQPDAPRSNRKGIGILKRVIGSTVRERMAAYDDYLLWNVIFPRHLPELHGVKAVEVGSAPGEFLVRFGHTFGCVPFGLDYSEVGVQMNKEVFGRYGFDPANVTRADFLSGEFQQQHGDEFDVVISRGFIEHFTDVEAVIDRHMEILKPGGTLVVSIPNLSGVNRALARTFDKEAIPRHNTGIMRKHTFAQLFDRKDLQASFCDYYGTFSLYLFTADQSRAKRQALKLSYAVQPFLNIAFRTLLGNKGWESGLLSPSLLYIGRKVSSDAHRPGGGESAAPRPSQRLVSHLEESRGA